MDAIDINLGTLSKTPGAVGGYCAGSAVLVIVWVIGRTCGELSTRVSSVAFTRMLRGVVPESVTLRVLP